MPRRRLLVGVVLAAVLLVGGRTLSALYADYTWYGAMGAGPLWSERAGNMLLIYGFGWVVTVLISFVESLGTRPEHRLPDTPAAARKRRVR